jgi:hypothetical protein
VTKPSNDRFLGIAQVCKFHYLRFADISLERSIAWPY